MENILEKGLFDLGFLQEDVNRIFSCMEKYVKEIQLFNSAYNLVNTSEYDELVTRHILDSLAPYQIIKEIESEFEKPVFADIGSGGGLPGIPLACAFPFHNFTLVERMDKRCAFLENVCALLGLKNVTVQKTEAENVTPESFDIVVFRAFRPLEKNIAKTLLSLTKTGGVLLAYKAKMENVLEDVKNVESLVSEYKIKSLTVPFLKDTERNLLIMRK
ncbi:MAG: 16S rRNA (guanine(527)-N(7))-methyltransferase RsmG [Treponema sp.]|nr:16S rRNA (guanine(527)-N(7))-methyltransferase RsmG [Treponema sp.]